MPFPVENVNGEDVGFLPIKGKLVVIKIRNVHPLMVPTITNGYIINDFPYSEIQDLGSYGGLELGFTCLSNLQDYSNTINTVNNTIPIPYPEGPLLDLMGSQVLSFPYNWTMTNHRFWNQFDLRNYSNTGDEFIFKVTFFPIRSRSYSAQLVIEHQLPGSSHIHKYRINFTGRRYGNIDEIDHTEYPDMVFEINHITSSNILKVDA
tara:strand:- start:842 stop:1459 length:618 start_codon:yes stop_codon:yes gene_type:complete